MAKCKILLVDDEMEFAATLAERLQIRGYDTRAVYCAEDAFETVQSFMPEVVLLDLKMPGMSGIEVLKKIKYILQSAQVILLTGHGSEQCAAEWMESGASDYAIKPVEIDALTSKIQRLMERRSI